MSLTKQVIQTPYKRFRSGPQTPAMMRDVPAPGADREARLFKIVGGVKVQGKKVAEVEKLSDSEPIATEGNTSQVQAGAAGIDSSSSGNLLSGLGSILPTVLIIGAVAFGGVMLLKAGKKSGGGKGRKGK